MIFVAMQKLYIFLFKTDDGLPRSPSLFHEGEGRPAGDDKATGRPLTTEPVHQLTPVFALWRNRQALPHRPSTLRQAL